ncbi:MAG: alpha/beta hydrolase [Gemmataceae bacterium]|nr:alpha/beta hydrolase [Gemmataceae bacterium]
MSIRRRVGRVMALALLAYAALIVVLMCAETYLIYHPAGQERWRPAPKMDVRDVSINSSDGETIHAWWLPRPGAKSAVLYSHGNSGNLSHRGSIAARISRELDASILLYDYPGFGRSTGSPTEAGCLAAAESAYKWLTTTAGFDGNHIILFGKSLGGGPTAYLAARVPHRAVVLVRTFTSIPDAAADRFPIVPARWLTRTQFNNLSCAGSCCRPAFVYHGDADTVVPVDHAHRLFAGLPGPKELFIEPGGTHVSELTDEFYRRLRAFLATAAAD